MKYTREPWSFNQETGEVEAAGGQVSLAKILNDEASYWCEQDLDKEDIANGERIVKCVNAHDALVGALRAFMEFDMRCDTELLHGGDQRMQEAIIRAKQALEVAGERV